MSSSTLVILALGAYVAYQIWRDTRPSAIQRKYAAQQDESITFSKEGRELMLKNYADNLAVQKEIAVSLDRIATALESRPK